MARASADKLCAIWLERQLTFKNLELKQVTYGFDRLYLGISMYM